MTTSASGYFSDLSEAIAAGWNRFWFTPVEPAQAAVLRIAAGLLAIAHLASLGADLERWYARDGLLAPMTVTKLLADSGETVNYHYSYLGRFAAADIHYAHWAAIAVAAAFTAGLLTPVSGALTAAALLAYIHRVPQVTGHLEPVLVFLVIYLVVAHSGSRLSLDRWLFRRRVANVGRSPAPSSHSAVGQSTALSYQSATGEGPLTSVLANIGLRLIQVHLAMFYAMMALTKLYGDAWWEGTAIWYLLAQTHSRPVDLSSLRGWGRSGALLINFWTQSILYYELAFPILIWNRLSRPIILGVGVIIWLSLIVATGHLLFGLAMLIASAAFLPAEFFRPARGATRLPA